MIRRFLRRAVVPALNQLYMDIGGGPESTIFVAGTERSGTTWLADCINFRRDYRLLFEPFWPHQVPLSAPLSPQEYIRREGGSDAQLQCAERILSGRLRNRWVDQYRRRGIARKRLVKDVRSNLYLAWLHHHFQQMPIVLIVRHPCAVARSQIERRHDFGSVADTLLSQPQLVEDFLHPFEADITRKHSPFEDRVFRWAIQTYVPLRQLLGSAIHVCCYEDLCIEPAKEFSRLFDFLKLDFNNGLLETARKPSPMSRDESPVKTGEDLVASWQAHVSTSDASSAADILRLFGLDRIYGVDPMPHPGGRQQFQGS